MWKTQEVDGSKLVREDNNLVPLLTDLNQNEKSVIPISENVTKVIRKSEAARSLKGKGLQSLSKVQWWSIILVIAGCFSLSIGILSIKSSPFQWIMSDFLEMRPFSPISPIWTDPPHVITISVNIFEAVNHEEFLASDDPNVKLEMRDIGAVVYREHIKHVNVSHNDNGTLSYTTVRHVEFLEDRNEPGILNRTIVVPNFGLIGALSFLHEISFFAKLAFNVMLNSKDEPIFINTTVYDFLWSYHSDVITLANNVLPSLVPVDNLGIMQQMYEQNVDHVNVKYGQKNGFDQFFNMQQYNYVNHVPGFNPENGDCNATIEDSSEAYLYNRFMTNETVINYFRKSICQVIPLHYERSSELLGLKVNEYVLRPESMKRKANLTADCYKGSEEDDYVLPDGLTDMSKCYFNFPMVLSLPHFYGFENASWNDRLAGLEPTLEKHQSRIIAEPIMGAGVRQYARSQVNVNVRDLSGFPGIYQRFSHMIMPIFWAELMLDQPPPFVLFLMRVCANYLPLIDIIIPCIFMGSGILLWAIALRKNSRKSRK